MALDNPDSLGDKVALCRRRKGLLVFAKILKSTIAVTGAIYTHYGS